ncbi:MAG: putative LPS assembly protein LptD, partial [Candidatus Zixiibacteriota bacterium]
MRGQGRPDEKRGGARTCVRLALSFWLGVLSLQIASAVRAQPIKLKRSDFFELIRGAAQDTIHTFGNVRFEQSGTEVYCDSAVWIVDSALHLWGAVRFKDGPNLLEADSIVYNLVDSVMNARGSVRYLSEESDLRADSMIYRLKDSTLYATGDSVVLISESDSIRAVGDQAFFDRTRKVMEMLGRPVVRFGYPDSSAERTIVADYIRYEYSQRSAIARGGVELKQHGSIATAACAQLDSDPERIRLYDSADVIWGKNDLSGDFITLLSADGQPVSIEVYGSGEANLIQPDTVHGATAVVEPDTLGAITDTARDTALAGEPVTHTERPTPSSVLNGDQLRFSFTDGKLRRVDSYGQARSLYKPGIDARGMEVRNAASGDSISLFIENDELSRVEVFSSVQGAYSERNPQSAIITDGAPPEHEGRINAGDTVQYRGDYVSFDLLDSSIAMAGRAEVEQGTLFLKADSIMYLTAAKFLKAYAVTEADSTLPDSASAPDTAADLDETHDLGRVTLIDGSQQVDGAYLEFSLNSKKGLIMQSKTGFDQAYYTGAELYRETEEVYFVDDGSYTTCNLDSPHFRFWSKDMKLINGDKVVAKPVVFFVEKIPILIIPYYVFPLRKGRRSGALNFRFGNFNQGGRFVSDVGYYWAASEYWDLLGSFDFYEVSGPIARGRARYNKRYSYNGEVSGQYAWESSFNSSFQEEKSKRWFLTFNHRHPVSQTFDVNAAGSFISDSRFFNDFSDNLEDRLNRSLRSQVNFTKRFGRTSVTGSYIRDENLDTETKRITYPNMSFSLPTLRPFGSPAQGESRKWYHTLTFTYRGDLRRLSDAQNRN